MGWGRTLLLGDVGNRLDIGDLEREVARLWSEVREASREDESQDEELQHLRAENAELKLYLASLVRLLVTKGTFTRAEYATLVDIIDSEDGVIDGRSDTPVI